MKSLLIAFLSLCFCSAIAQVQKTYVFNVELSDYNDAPEFAPYSGTVIYTGMDAKQKTFFNKYTILSFYQTYPSSKRQKTLNMFTFTTKSASLAQDLLNEFPGKYFRIEDLTDIDIHLLDYYPNDYGTFSPVPNLGASLDLRSFDYIGAPKAWNYLGSLIENAKIGISDGKIYDVDAEFSGKTTFLTSFPNIPFATGELNEQPRHGTGVSAIAAARGNNGYGMTGVCPECDLLNVNWSGASYDNLLVLANAGAKVINLSWVYGSSTNGAFSSTVGVTGFPSQQAVIDELHDMNVTLVAGAGNTNPFQPLYASSNYMFYCFPASYNHVISVTAMNYKNSFQDDIMPEPNVGNISRYVKDMVSPYVLNGSTPLSFLTYISTDIYTYGYITTTNDKVDICAPGYQVPSYSRYLLGEPVIYVNATSPATPYVTGTFGLMYSLNPCLINDEAECILKLTSKNLESITGNEAFIGRSGSGKLETGDAVEFVDEMKKPTGNALIDGQDFYRFDFKLSHINNKLTISNQIFRDICTADFAAKKTIELLKDTDLKPSTTGFTDLKIDAAIDVNCSESAFVVTKNESNLENVINGKLARLYPNPNDGSFKIEFSEQNCKEVSVNIFDVFGKLVYQDVTNGVLFDINLSNLPTGLYIVKLNSENFNEAIKFVKN